MSDVNSTFPEASKRREPRSQAMAITRTLDGLNRFITIESRRFPSGGNSWRKIPMRGATIRKTGRIGTPCWVGWTPGLWLRRAGRRAERGQAERKHSAQCYCYGYTHDPIGNRLTTTVNGRSATYMTGQPTNISSGRCPARCMWSGAPMRRPR